MLQLPAGLRTGAQKSGWVGEFNRAISAARKTLARRRMIGFAAATLWGAILLSCAWIMLVRFTLLDLPRSVALVPIIGWMVALVLFRTRSNAGIGESARYLDRTLKLDERVATSLQLVRSSPVIGLRSRKVRLPQALLDDTAFLLNARRGDLPSGWRYSLQRWQGIALAASLVALCAAMLAPTPLDQIRAERAEMERAVRAEISRVEELRAELLARPGLGADSKESIDAELSELQEILATPQLERSAMLAAIADTQERLQGLSPQSPADFAGVLAAARTIQNAALSEVRSATVQFGLDNTWSPEAFPDLSELGRGAEAARALAGWIDQLTSIRRRALSSALVRAEDQASSENTVLGQQLLDVSNAVLVDDVQQAEKRMMDVSQSFLDADKEWQVADAVERALSDLDDGRQTLAQVGAKEERQQQVGFRRPGSPPDNKDGSTGTTPSPQGQDPQAEPGAADEDGGVTRDSPSAFGQNMGMNSPEFNSTNSSGGEGGQKGGSGEGQSSGAGTGGSDGSSTGAGQPGSVAGGGSGNDRGTFGGEVNGAVGGAGGAISQVENPAGQGIAQPGSEPGNDKGEGVYVPPAQVPGGVATGTEGTTGEAPTGDPRTEGLEGQANGEGDDAQRTEETGSGAKTQVRTPYKEVIGEYVAAATRSLESTYIPADAKEYVKDYFTELGK